MEGLCFGDDDGFPDFEEMFDKLVVVGSGVVMWDEVKTTEGCLCDESDFEIDKDVEFVVKVVDFLVIVGLATVVVVGDVFADLEVLEGLDDFLLLCFEVGRLGFGLVAKVFEDGDDFV